LLFLKDQIKPKHMSGNLQACSSSQNIQNPGVSEKIYEENGDNREGNATDEPLPETYTEVTNEPPSETGLSTSHRRKRPCSNGNQINAKLIAA
jgi:hypothetical protein